MKRIIYFLMAACLIGCLPAVPLSAQDERGLIFEGLSIKDKDGNKHPLYHASHALVIGISNYAHWPKLPGVKKDIEAVKASLEAHGFHVEVATDLERSGLERTFNQFINQHGHDPENRLLFYFAGHGHTRKLSYGDEMGYIIPADAPLPRDESGFLAKAIDMQMVEVYARRIEAKHALFLFDACFSGSLFALSRAVPEIISYKTTQPVRQFITSGSAEEAVPDESIFRAQFVRALEGEADSDLDGYVTGTELGEFLQRTVVNYSHNAQHPQYGKIRHPHLDKGDVVFLLVPEAPVEETPKTVATAVPLERIDPEIAMWKLVEHSENISDVEDFLLAFPEGKLARVAQLKLKQLKRRQPPQREAIPASVQTPVPTSVPLAPKDDPQIAQLLKQAGDYFKRQWYTTPEDTNAFDIYQEVLRLDPANERARQQIEEIANFYLSRGERAEQRGQTAQAIQYYQKYLKIVPDHTQVSERIVELEQSNAPLVLDSSQWDSGHWQ